MRYKELVYQGKTYTEKYKIDEVLIAKKLNWLIDAEVENLRIEIHSKEDEFTLIVNAGKWYNGIFQYGVIRDIEWLNGTFKNGVWYNGIWKNGIFEHGLIFNGKFYDGKILAGKIHGGDFFDVEISEKVEKIEEQPIQPQMQTSGQTQAQIQPVSQSGQTQMTQPQTTGQTQAQTPEEESQQVQKTIEAITRLEFSNEIYVKETVVFKAEDELDFFLTINEIYSTDVNEGLKGWTAGALLLIMSILSPSKIDAQITSIQDKEKTIDSIENVINNEEQLNRIAFYLNKNGYNSNVNAIKSRITKNADDLINRIEDEDNLSQISTTDPAKASRLIRQGYCITNAEINTVIDTIYADVEEIPVDTVSYNGTSDDFFAFSSIVLTDDAKNEIKGIADTIKESGNVITNIIILSGTDNVRIEPNGELRKQGINNNQDLAQTRANVIKDYLGSIGIDTSMVTVCLYPNNIENKPGFQPDRQLRIAGVEILSIPAPIVMPKEPIVNTSTSANFTLVKNIHKFKKSGIKTHIKLNTTKNNIPKRSVGKKLKCATWH